MRKLSMDELNRKSVEEFKQAEKIPIIILLENIRSMHNVGSVFRTADAFLITSIYLCGYTPKPPHRDIHKTALGAEGAVNWQYFSSALEAIKQLKRDDYKIFAIEQVEKSIQLQHFSPWKKEKIVVIFGNEVDGISYDVLNNCDGYIQIPQVGMKHSLNISVAAGIVLWEMVRGRICPNTIEEV